MSLNVYSKIAEYIWINGEFIKKDQALIHAVTHSLHYAGAVFEGERAYGGKVFMLQEHTERLIKSADHMRLKMPYSADIINKATQELLAKNNLKNAYVRPLIWRGSESINLCSKDLSINLLIYAAESNPAFKSGLNVNVGIWRKPHPDSMNPQCKSSAHYAMNIISQDLAIADGYDDSLLLDLDGNIAECTTTNIFFGKDNKIVTPIADKFLDGITRQSVIKMARAHGFDVEEKRLNLSDIHNFDLCFQTGTSGEITGISSIDIGAKKLLYPNIDMLKKLQAQFAALVGKEV
jgi:branched-chain amino acid aminotransferase